MSSLHLGHLGSCSSKHQRNLHILPVCSRGSCLDSLTVGSHCPVSRSLDNLDSQNIDLPGSGPTLGLVQGSLNHWSVGSRTGSRLVLRDSTSETSGTWAIRSPGATEWGRSPPAKMDTLLARGRRKCVLGRRRLGRSRWSSGCPPPPAPWGSCCPLAGTGTRKKSAKRRRVDDLMILHSGN